MQKIHIKAKDNPNTSYSIQAHREIIGSILVNQGQIIGRGHYRSVQQDSTILHGEMDGLEKTGRPVLPFRTSALPFRTLSVTSFAKVAI